MCSVLAYTTPGLSYNTEQYVWMKYAVSVYDDGHDAC